MSHKAVTSWVGLLERVHALFVVPPFGAPGLGALRQERRLYLLDWSAVPEAAARFRSMVGCHLLKWVHHQRDAFGRALELRHFKDVEGREADFVAVERRRPILIVGCREAGVGPDPGLRLINARFRRCEARQVTAEGGADRETPEGIRLAPALTFLRRLV